MKKKKNLNEEIERIKSLFTEERLYGNLVEQMGWKYWADGPNPNYYQGNASGFVAATRKWHDEKVEMAETMWEYKHEIIDALSIIVLVIPVVGPLISIGLEGVNAAIYFAEGDETMGLVSMGLMLIPGGFVARRAFKSKGIIKEIDNVTEWTIKQHKAGEIVTKEAFEKKLKKELGEKTFNKNKAVITRYFDDIVPQLSKTGFKNSVKLLDKVRRKSPNYWKSFIGNPKAFEKFMLKNGGDMYRAYLAYLKSVATKEFLIASGIVTIIISFGDELVTFALEEIPGVKESLLAYKKWTLKQDADEGNISSIVRHAGYDWDVTKKVFMVTPYSENKDQNVTDNLLLKKAWRSGWRPYDKNTPDSPLIIPDEEFWTPKMKEFNEEEQKKLEDKIEKEMGDINIQVIDGDRKLVIDDLPQGIDYDINKTAFSLDSLNMVSPDKQNAFDDFLKGDLDNSDDFKFDIEKNQELEKLNKNLNFNDK